MAEEDEQGSWVCPCIFFSPLVFGFVLVVVGSIWSAAACHSECGCTADRSCEVSESCPSETPCSCLNITNASVATCESLEDNCGSHETTIQLMLTVGNNLILFYYRLFTFVMTIVWYIWLVYGMLCVLLLLVAFIVVVFNAIRTATRRVAPYPNEQSGGTEVELETVPVEST